MALGFNDVLLQQPVNLAHPWNDGLVSWWLALPQTANGVTFRDLCGRNHGTKTNAIFQTFRCPPWIPGSLDFDGASGNVLVADHDSLKGMAQLSIFFWAHPDSAGEGGFGRVIVKNDSTDWSISYQTALFSGSVGGTASSTAAASASADTWYHVGMVYDGAKIRMYLNGVRSGAETAKTGTVPSTTAPVYIGNRAADDRTFDGNIADIRIYNRAIDTVGGGGPPAALYAESKRGYPNLLNRLYRPMSIPIAAGPPPVAAYPFWKQHGGIDFSAARQSGHVRGW